MSSRFLPVVLAVLTASSSFMAAADVPNFTPFVKDTVLARDGDYRYTVGHDEERLVFPNATVKPGLRAGLLVVETTQDTLSSLV